MGQREDTSAKSSPAQWGGGTRVHPRAQSFFDELAQARRAKRRIMLSLDLDSTAFQTLLGASRPQQGRTLAAVAPLPGEDASPVAAPPAAATSSDHGPDGGVVTSSSGTARFGLNVLHAHELRWQGGIGVVQSTKYGVGDQPFVDAARLGARVVRQHGSRDLLWGQLTPAHPSPVTESQMNGQASVPLASGVAGALQFGIGSSGAAQLNVTRLAEVMGDAKANSVKLVFTFLYLGGSGKTTSHLPPQPGAREYDSSDVEYTNPPSSPKATIDWDGAGKIGQSFFSEVPWELDHQGQTSPSGAFAFPVHSSDAALTPDEWFSDALDPACPYKREYIGLIATQTAKLLLAAAAAMSVDLADVVEAIEIFNETDIRDFWSDPSGAQDMTAAGEKWGRAYLHAAWAFRQALGPSDVKLWMPGIASYRANQGGDWADKLAYVDGFVQGMVYEATDAVDALGWDSQSVLEAFPSLVQGIDLHWYHQEEELLHIGFLTLELAELRDKITWAMAEYNDELLGGEFDDFPISVFESGWALGDPLPAGVAGMSAADQEGFQAAEVWRRIGGALAGGADIVSWHSWMSLDSGDYEKVGLRDDTQLSRAPASDAVPRPAWFAYAVLASVLGDRVASGRMVLPAVSSRAQLRVGLTRSPDLYGAVVFELQLSGASSTVAAGWAYLVLRDPSVESQSNLVATPAAGVGRAAGIQVYGPRWLSRELSPGTPRKLPVWSVSTAPTTIPCAPFMVEPSWAPVLYLSSRRLEWQVVRTATSASPTVAERLYSRPAWMDDPGCPLPGTERG